jgi:hypothetical protein
MSQQITNAFEKVIDRRILEIAYEPLSSYIEDNYMRLNLANNAKTIENVEQSTLLDFELIRINDIIQNGEMLLFQIIIVAEIEIEETVRRDREVENINKKFVLSCSANIDDIQGSFTVDSIEEY